MESQNEPQAPSPAPLPDFNQELRNAQKTGDFDFVLDTAKKSHRMLTDFRDAVRGASYSGATAPAISMGLNFLENMISNSAGQISALKQAEKQTREALKASLKAKENPGVPIGVVEPEVRPQDLQKGEELGG